ncbi:MAG: Permease of the drug/metabolite transporter (DMT) superfamily [uncultured Paraburkholderia sp.]|nr:MAG: Permease of the drug/metabolite transporter (DMT) superfamily [uncultured Paraburkholderia sp.]CAH2920240.1 MAG: Permease of the drug/metabolite transporter (DMT) superfamily [uncultured Paraburkholderia sp.]
MLGLASTPAATSSLLLNLEGVLTAAIAWVVFRENVDLQVFLGMVAIVAAGASLPSPGTMAAAMATGFAGYGVSLVLFVVALRHLGTARTGAYFSVAPLFGVLLSLAIWPTLPDLTFCAAVLLMALGIWLHVRERHVHEHTHELLEHSHRHRHDAHHQHDHDFPYSGDEPHTHPHVHLPISHSHAHFPDIHHRHRH